MKSKLYYYELVIKTQAPSTLLGMDDLLHKLHYSRALVLGFKKNEISKSRKSKSGVSSTKTPCTLELQVAFLHDIHAEDLMVIGPDITILSSRTRSITGDDVDIYQSYHIISDVNQKLLMSGIGGEKHD